MKKALKWMVIAFVGLVVLGMIIDATKSPEQKAAELAAREQGAAQRAEAERERAKQEMDALPAITAAQLAAAYDENTVAADQQFKHRRFKVSGRIVDISTDFLGHPYLTLNGGSNEFIRPQFSFKKSDEAQLATLKKGSKVTLVCVGKGDVAKIPMSDSCSLL